ncbi:MAG: hypothetical protein KME20_21450 [Kaiparowitsia implicata GSE-PSE-MK54-09C]|jgi:hypothetical protein|nr:hypothetical protein [Kaiparowitsia implicata GSE-PSE-MK54-09C]
MVADDGAISAGISGSPLFPRCFPFIAFSLRVTAQRLLRRVYDQTQPYNH